MMLPFFYNPQLQPGTQHLELDEDTSRHCVQVLRMQAGNRMHLTNGAGALAVAEITQSHKKHCQVQVNTYTQTPAPEPKAALAVSLLKNTGRFEWLLEKAAELGIAEIIPLICKRTEKQHFRHDRMRQIVISAMLQSQQVWLPVLQAPVAVETFLGGCGYVQKFFAHCMEGDKQPLLQAVQAAGSRICCIGPEGDFTAEEMATALAKGFTPVSLGHTRLRTETAGMTAAVILKTLDSKH